MKSWLVCLLLAIALPAHAQDRLNVVASFSILGDFARNVGGDRIEVATLVGANGDVHVPEDRLRSAMANAMAGKATFEYEVDRLLGKPWDDELEPFRRAGDGAPVR